ncbi:hypothetical protein AGABI2DRAFT_115729 [Agaricus bisporus var. bisporus H97]|uniref:hypothetical protein n=1 Tax=Agaricus bisporus var. bisporus (strain H97 / ATCC MYA-4626 / FGSC 10389) TaxID=936046 RepID=UPI00029F68DE|nr:hypothetical protein AGABI2DRAFT_115729 [Agaricus bisporus var. bisporus H97]EKV50661.1 hypothetical protein AGABI2DRAFT_115729 [Agaricus bisporus var. bisporus H97]
MSTLSLTKDQSQVLNLTISSRSEERSLEIVPFGHTSDLLRSRLVTAFRGAIASAHDPCTTSLSHLSFDVELHADPSDLLRSNAEPMGWAGLRRLAFDVLSSFEGPPDAYSPVSMQPICVQKYVTSVLLTLLSYPNAITPCARADIIDRLMRDETTVFNDEYLVTFTPSNNYSVADFIIATSNEVSPIVIGMIHLARCDHGVARAFHHFSRHQISWERFYCNRLPGIPSIQEIAHFVHCQTPVWPSRVSSTLSDDEVEFMAALFVTAHGGF